MYVNLMTLLRHIKHETVDDLSETWHQLENKLKIDLE